MEKFKDFEMEESECDHEGWVSHGVCERCGAGNLWSDDEIYEMEAPR